MTVDPIERPVPKDRLWEVYELPKEWSHGREVLFTDLYRTPLYYLVRYGMINHQMSLSLLETRQALQTSTLSSSNISALLLQRPEHGPVRDRCLSHLKLGLLYSTV